MTRRFVRRVLNVLLLGLLFGLLAGVAAAQSTAQQPRPQRSQIQPRVAVFPFVSETPRLGFAVADRLTHAFAEPSLPPELALGLVPPYILQEGRFISPLTLLGTSQTASRHAAELLREALGVSVAVTGRVRYSDAGLELHLFVADSDGSRSFRFSAPEGEPRRLVASARAVLRVYGDLTPLPDAPLGLDLSSPYGTFIDGLVQVGSGFSAEALPLLEQAATTPAAEPRWSRRAAALAAVLANPGANPEGAAARTPLLAAVTGLNTQPFNAPSVRRAFAASDLPLAHLWRALLALQVGDGAQAQADFAALDTAAYPFAATEQLLAGLSRDVPETATDLEALLQRQPDALSALVGGLFVAQTLRDGALEQRLAERLTEAAPAFAYPYERLSQVAFDQDDPLSAASVLKTATRLEPQNDLYWTNLGWAYYLLGLLEPSQQASQRAITLSDGEFIAWYNLALAQVVSGQLETALATYDQATARDLAADDTLDPSATDDLQNALTRYPDVPGVHYALGALLEADGQVAAAATQFERYAARGRGALVAAAQERVTVLRAPPPPLTISPGARVGVGPDALTFPRYAPGDLLYARFELSTPGPELPTPLTIEVQLLGPAGRVQAQTTRSERTPLPPETVALEITDASLELPRALPPGRYTLKVTASARGRQGQASLPLTVTAARAPLVRQLLGRDITLRDVISGQPLYAERDASGSAAQGDKRLIGTLLAQLSRSASAAAETLPDITRGRFAGQAGDVLFDSSRPRDVRDFLGFLLAVGAGTDAPFAELYANWALEGAPTP